MCMKILVVICLLFVFVSCKNSKVETKERSVLGTWLLIDYNRLSGNFWSKENDVPLGFRFYSQDSAEIYRQDYFYMLERFTPYKLKNDSLHILKSDSLGWWKRKISLTGDSMILRSGPDTIIYLHLFNNPSTTQKKFDKIVLTTGSSWGDFLGTIIYPDGKTLIYLRPLGGAPPDKFFIRHTPGLFDRIIESGYWINQMENHPSFDLFLEKFRDGVTLDGGNVELLLVSKDSIWLNEHSQLGAFNNHLFGLSNYTLSRILKKDFKTWYQTMPSLKYDSVRSTLPLCRVNGILNHRSVVMLIMEAIQGKNRVNDHGGELNICFELTCGPKDEHRLCTNGQIISVDYFRQYDVGYDFIDILKHH